jgi:hypothetical protein
MMMFCLKKPVPAAALSVRIEPIGEIVVNVWCGVQTVFPSGFLFINNVFYVDGRAGCRDTSAVVREWAAARGLGNFVCKDMHAVRFRDLVLRLGHPEVS